MQSEKKVMTILRVWWISVCIWNGLLLVSGSQSFVILKSPQDINWRSKLVIGKQCKPDSFKTSLRIVNTFISLNCPDHIKSAKQQFTLKNDSHELGKCTWRVRLMPQYPKVVAAVNCSGSEIETLNIQSISTIQQTYSLK